MSEGTARQAIVMGVVTALVGFTSSFAVVLAGLRAVGADPAEAASGLLALCLAVGFGTIVLSRWFRLPITLAWSTPGAAMLAGAATVEGGWPAAVGAFVVTGALVVVTAAWPGLGRLVQRIPTTVAQAMLAGVLLPLCVAPVQGLVSSPALVAPVVVIWLVLLRLAPRWAVPAALLVTVVVVLAWAARHGEALAGPWAPQLTLTVPEWSWQAVVGIAIPLYVVTMAAQNIPGVAVMSSLGYEVPWRPSLLVSGAATVAAAPLGGHAVNLAAISAALAAGPEAGPDPRRRWLASQTSGITMVLLAGASTALATVVAAAPAGVVEAAAGLALLGTLGASLTGALAGRDPGSREAAVVTFVVAASGIVVGGIGAAFWSLVAGVVVTVVLRRPA